MAINLWTRFRQLLPKTPLIIVTVTAINTDGTSTVTTVGGGGMRVAGTSVAVDSKAYVKDGRIQGEAPNLPHYEISV